jgi:hypothetical protein
MIFLNQLLAVSQKTGTSFLTINVVVGWEDVAKSAVGILKVDEKANGRA